MQTFLPYADFARTAAVLDGPRLGKQRVETLQILRALTLPDYGWANHPAVTMWRGRTAPLVVYGLACVREWTARGHADSTAPSIQEFAPEVCGQDQDALDVAGLLPSWLGDERLHVSHRSALLRKDPGWYRPRFGLRHPDDVPYYWPPADDVAPQTPPAGRPIWVVRPADAAALGRFLGQGVVGLGAESGLAVDVAGMDGAAMRAALRELAPGRRPGKQLRQLETFVHGISIGDDVAVPIEAGTALLLGRVVGDYAFDGERGEPVHRRPVRWEGRLQRSDLQPRAALQDPRQLFLVRVRHTALVSRLPSPPRRGTARCR